MAYALYEFVGRKGETKIGRQSWILSHYQRSNFRNEYWDKRDVIEVGWPADGSLMCTHPGAAKYPVKVLWISDDKAELQKIREETNKKSPMGRGHRIKKRKIIESESDDNVSQQQPKKKKSKQPDNRSLMKEILEEVPQQTTDKDSTIQRLEKELEEVKQEKKELRAENKNMRRMIRIMTNLPDMMAQMRDLMTPSTRSTDGGSTNNMVQPEAPQKTITTGIDAIMKRCNHQEPAKMVNDVLTGMYSNQYLAGRTLTGVSGSGKEAKEPMDPEVVNGIIERVTASFPKTALSLVRGMMRQKLANAVKTVRRKTEQ